MFGPVLRSFPQPPHALTARQLECIRCGELFTIAEDRPNRLNARSHNWRLPKDQYPSTPLRFDGDRSQVGVNPEIRTEPGPIQAELDSTQSYYINCPRCGADNRNWLFVSTQMEIRREPIWLFGSVITISLLIAIIFLKWSDLFEGHTLALICLILAALLPLYFIPRQWPALRNYKMVRRFLPMVPSSQITPTLQTAVTLYIVLILFLPVLRYAAIPAVQNVAIALQQAFNPAANDDEADSATRQEKGGFWEDWLLLGSAVSVLSSSVALMSVGGVLDRVNNQLPRPIYANSANMVRVALWEAKRALEIDAYFDRIQWMMTRRNEQGGINMIGYFRDPPEFSANGHLEERVRVQKYTISTDRWCVITRAKIEDTKDQRPANGGYDFLFAPKSKTTIMVSGREKH